MIRHFCDVCGTETEDASASKLSLTKKWDTTIKWERHFVSWSDICQSCSDRLQNLLREFERAGRRR